MLLEFSFLFFSVFRVSAYYEFVFLNECCYWCLLSVVDSSLAVVSAFWRWFASIVFLFYFVLLRFSGDRSSQGKEIKKEWRGCRGGGGLLLRGGSSSFEQHRVLPGLSDRDGSGIAALAFLRCEKK